MPNDARRWRAGRPKAAMGASLLVALLLIWGAVALHMVHYRADLRRSAGAVADMAADGLAESAVRGVAQADQILRYGATLHSLAPLLSAGDAGADWLAATDFGMPPGMWAALVEPAGGVVTLSPGEASVMMAAQDARAHFAQHPDTDLFTEQVRAADADRAADRAPARLAFARILPGAKGGFAGSVVVVVDPMALLRAARSLDVGVLGRVALIGPDWAELVAIGGAPSPDSPPAFVFRERSLPYGGLRVRVGLAEAEVFAPFAREWMASVLVGFLLSAACGAMAWTAARRNVVHADRQAGRMVPACALAAAMDEARRVRAVV